MGKMVVIAALDATFERNVSVCGYVMRQDGTDCVVVRTRRVQAFDNVIKLIPTAEQVIKLNAICSSCGHDAGAIV